MQGDSAPLARVRGRFPLSSLALLITALACLLACVDIERWNVQYEKLRSGGAWQVVALFAGAGLFGGVIGLFYALSRRSGWRALFAAPIMGMLAAVAGVLILLAPGAMWKTVFVVAVMLMAAVVFRLDAD